MSSFSQSRKFGLSNYFERTYLGGARFPSPSGARPMSTMSRGEGSVATGSNLIAQPGAILVGS